MISFHWGEGTYWKGWILQATASPALHPLDLTACGQSTLWRSVHLWHLYRGHRHRVSDLCRRTEDALKERSLSPMAYCSAPTSCPVLIPDAKEVELNWCWFLSGKVYFASFLVTAYAKCSITSSSSTTCWKLSVSTQAGHSALMWGSIHLPQHEVKYSQTLTQRGAGFWGFAALLLLLLY